MNQETIALQARIDQCARQGGGRVTVPAGRHTVGFLRLKDNVELYLSEGAVLYLSEDYGDFPPITTARWNAAYAPRRNTRCMIYAENAENVSITGPGLIDCDGKRFCESDDSPGRVNDLRRKTAEVIPRVIFFVGCKGFALRDFTLRDAPAGWSVWLLGCSDGVVERVSLLADFELPNADGLHISCCQDIEVQHCRFSTGDDALVVRAYQAPLWEPFPCQRIHVRDCFLASHSSGIRVGWCGDAAIRDCTFTDLTFGECVNGIVLQFPFFDPPALDEGRDIPDIRDLRFERLDMPCILFEPIHVSLVGKVKAHVTELLFRELRAVSRRKCRFSGTPDSPLGRIRLENCRFQQVETLEASHIPNNYWNEQALAGQPMVQYVQLELDEDTQSHA